MRKLIYVPIIHINADLGDIASEVNVRGRRLVGEDKWSGHKQAVLGFWDSIARYFESIDVKNFKIYQDGLMTDGEVGFRIVSDGVKKGSKNYEIVSRLISRGAILMKTENFALVKREYDYLIKITKAKGFIKKIIAALNYKYHKKKLLEERDKYIARALDKTLGKGETGILLLGAHHHIIPKLPQDIKITELKKRERVKEYQKSFISKKDTERLKQLTDYLISPVE